MNSHLSIAFSIAVALGMPVAAAAQNHHAASQRLITLQGEGEATAAPDLATIKVGVTTVAESAADALEANTQAMQQLFQSLGELGVAQKDMQTSDFSVSPQYRHDEQGRQPQIVAYEVRNQVQVKVRDLDKLGRILDEAVAQGANQIQGISFSVDDPSRALDEARRQAVEDAQRRARLYAQAVGVELGRLHSLSEQSFSVPPPRPLQFARAAAAESVPIAAGEEEFRVQITVQYAIASDAEE